MQQAILLIMKLEMCFLVVFSVISQTLVQPGSYRVFSKTARFEDFITDFCVNRFVLHFALDIIDVAATIAPTVSNFGIPMIRI